MYCLQDASYTVDDLLHRISDGNKTHPYTRIAGCMGCLIMSKTPTSLGDPKPPPLPLELVCEPFAEYLPWSDNVPEIEVG